MCFRWGIPWRGSEAGCRPSNVKLRASLILRSAISPARDSMAPGIRLPSQSGKVADSYDQTNSNLLQYDEFMHLTSHRFG
jgi:hypothetical protein